MDQEYNAASIKVLKQSDCEDKWDWAKLGRLSDEYGVPLPCLELAVESCHLAGVEFQYYIDKYLKKIDLPINKELTYIYNELMVKRRR